jgi:hypothetical protein
MLPASSKPIRIQWLKKTPYRIVLNNRRQDWAFAMYVLELLGIKNPTGI